MRARLPVRNVGHPQVFPTRARRPDGGSRAKFSKDMAAFGLAADRWRPALVRASCLTVFLSLGCVFPMPSLSAAAISEPAPRRDGTTQTWAVLDSAHYVGRIEWSCAKGQERVRYVNMGPTERVAVHLGPALYARAWIQPRNGLELPLVADPDLGRVQRWRVKPISENPPPIVVFRVAKDGNGCARPIVSHQALDRPASPLSGTPRGSGRMAH